MAQLILQEQAVPGVYELPYYAPDGESVFLVAVIAHDGPPRIVHWRAVRTVAEYDEAYIFLEQFLGSLQRDTLRLVG